MILFGGVYECGFVKTYVTLLFCIKARSVCHFNRQLDFYYVSKVRTSIKLVIILVIYTW